MVRFKNRYVLFKLSEPDAGLEANAAPVACNSKSVYSALRKELGSEYGVFGLSSILPALQVKYYSNTENVVIMRIARAYVEELLVVLMKDLEIAGRNVRAQVMHVGGTIKSCQKQALAYFQSVFLEAARNATITPSELHNLQGTVQAELLNVEP